MIASQSQNPLSPEDYLESEKSSPIKHEYIQGQIYAISGASDAHVTITANLVTLLRNHLRGSGYKVYPTDMKVNIESLNVFYYPDLMVTCEPKDTSFDYFKRHPSLIIEILSPSTEAFDRGDKFANYRELESLQEYVLVNQTRPSVECFRLNSKGLWVLHTYRENQKLRLDSIDFSCSMAALYEDVIFSETHSS